jgi:predicted small secreted protein
MKPLMLVTPLLAALLMAGCATSGGAGMPPVDVAGADIASRTLDNGDVLEEYRVAGQLRMVKVTPQRGAPYYLYDQNGDGRMDSSRDGVSPVYWKLYSW